MDQPITVAKAWALAKYAKQISEKNKLFEEQRMKLVEKYGEKEKDGNYKFTKENEKKINDEFDKLLNIEETYEVEEVKLDENVKLTPKELIQLEDILVQ
jgi:hypothetical protein